jgi:hypothetical protein
LYFKSLRISLKIEVKLCPFFLLTRSSHHLQKIIRFQASTSDQSAIYIGLGEKLGVIREINALGTVHLRPFFRASKKPTSSMGGGQHESHFSFVENQRMSKLKYLIS